MMREEIDRIVESVLSKVHGRGTHGSTALRQTFRDEPGISPDDKAQVAELAYGVLRIERNLDRVLARLDGDRRHEERGPRDRDRRRLWLYRALTRTEESAGDEEAVLARGRYEELGAQQAADPMERVAWAGALPEPLAQMLLSQYGEEAPALASSLASSAPVTIRTTRTKIDREALRLRLKEEGLSARPTPLAPDGLFIETPGPLFETRAFHEGLFEVQDEGSQLVAELVLPPPRGLVVDACAGAGGKTLQIAALLGGRGKVLAVDLPRAEHKLEELRRRARRAGLSNVQAIALGDEEALPTEVFQADRILIDAPCSGSGVLRRNPEARGSIGPESVAELRAKQLRLLSRYAPAVQKGSRMVYATCSLFREENESVVEDFLLASKDFSLVPAKELLGRERALGLGDGQTLKLLPHRHGTDGFFAAVLRKNRT